MADRIHKYPFDVTDRFEIDMPEHAQVLTVQIQNDIPCMWARVDPSLPKVKRYFRVFGTGHEMPDSFEWNADYVGTFQQYDGKLVLHLFEEK